MLRHIVRFALRQRVLVLGATVLWVIVGARAFSSLPIEAFPDVEDIHVQVISLWPGRAAEEITGDLEATGDLAEESGAGTLEE